MQVILQISRAGAGFVQNAGDKIEVSDNEGKRLIEAGKAIPVRREKPIERAVKGRKK